MSELRGWIYRLLGREQLPEGFTGTLDGEERVLASATVSGGGVVVATSRGLWLPEGRRIGWHLVSKATWDSGALTVIEAVEQDVVGDAVILAEQRPMPVRLSDPGRVPEVVHKRVTSSIRSRRRVELPGGGAWFVDRAVAGRDGVQVQVRPDPGTEPEALRQAVERAADREEVD